MSSAGEPEKARSAPSSEVEGCRCGGCGNLYRVDILVPDDLWKRIRPQDGNLLCGPCIAQRIEAFGSFSAFNLETVK